MCTKHPDHRTGPSATDYPMAIDSSDDVDHEDDGGSGDGYGGDADGGGGDDVVTLAVMVMAVRVAMRVIKVTKLTRVNTSQQVHPIPRKTVHQS